MSDMRDEQADIEREWNAARERVLHSWRWYRSRRAALEEREDAKVDLRRLETLWQRARDRFLAEVDALNQRIEMHNQGVSPGRRWPRLDAEAALRQMEADTSAPGEEIAQDTREIAPPSPTSKPITPAEVVLHQIIAIREKIPHTPRWESARKRALWRYIARLQAQHNKE
ncbi:MAG: hypothetical protein J7M34_13470 [Anaerolineae bacterium]|nr:hypothetical protein [Anaerolineae bacterium]